MLDKTTLTFPEPYRVRARVHFKRPKKLTRKTRKMLQNILIQRALVTRAQARAATPRTLERKKMYLLML